MRARKPRQVNLSTETVIMDGGYNENISSLELGGGELREGINYYLVEGSSGGYRSTKGYERYDGQTLASEISLAANDDDTAREAQRALITEVPGTGDVLGIHIYKNTLYAFRNNAGDTATDMYVESGSGWTKIDLGSKITFDTGATSALTVGETLTGGTSSATGELLKVVITSGTIAGGDAAGYVIIDVLSGTFQSAETLTGGSSTGTIVSTSLAVDQTITKSGDYRFVNHNFYATDGSEYMYFTNEVNSAMVYDGTAFDFIVNSGMGSDDKPTHVIAHNDRLFLAYPGGSLQHSTIGDPEDWATSPGELGLGEDITGLLRAVGNALVIFCTNSTKVLQGTSDSDSWQLDTYSERSGAYEDTMFRMFGTIMFLNNRGVSTLEAVQDFGDFRASSISEKVYKTLQDYKNLVTTASVHRGLNQYRVFFSNGYGVVFSFIGRKFRGATLLQFTDPVHRTAVGTDSSGDPVVFFSSTGDGYVYKMESGTSFDGEDISSRLKTAFYHYKSPYFLKKFISTDIELSAESGFTASYRFYFDYDALFSPRGLGRTKTLGLSSVDGDTWGGSEWGTLVWSGTSSVTGIKPYIHGIGTNVSLGFSAISKTENQHTIQNMTLAFEKLRRQL